MRTTLSIDDDIYREIEKECRNKRKSMKSVINEALRRGMNPGLAVAEPRAVYSTVSVSLGGTKLSNVDDIAETLATIEGESSS